jgi:putative ABC transport system permease protein
MSGPVVLVWRLAVRDLRRRPVEAIMVFLVIAAAATTLTVALALSGVTDKPYQQTRRATAGPDVVAVYPAHLPTTLSGPAPTLASPASLTTAAGVIAHSGPYPTVYSSLSYRGHPVDVIAEGRDQTPR